MNFRYAMTSLPLYVVGGSWCGWPSDTPVIHQCPLTPMASSKANDA